MQNIYLVYNSNLNPNNKLSKVRSLIEKLKKQYLLQYLPQRKLTIDESMVQYLKKKLNVKKLMKNKFWVTATLSQYVFVCAYIYMV